LFTAYSNRLNRTVFYCGTEVAGNKERTFATMVI